MALGVADLQFAWRAPRVGVSILTLPEGRSLFTLPLDLLTPIAYAGCNVGNPSCTNKTCGGGGLAQGPARAAASQARFGRPSRSRMRFNEIFASVCRC
jgi:hypothetical protein